MQYCKRCGEVWSDTSSYHEINAPNFCGCCGNRQQIEDDGLSGEEYDKMSEEEKDEYDAKLIDIITSSDELDTRLWNTYNNPNKTAGFYYYFHYDKYEQLTGKRAGRKHTEEEIQRRNEEFEAKYGEGSPLYQAELLRRCVAADKAKKEANSNQVHCPYCNSTNVNKISGLAKAGSVALFGIFSQKVKKQWHCRQCGSDF